MLTVMEAERIAEALITEIRRLWPESVKPRDEIDDLTAEVVTRQVVFNLLADGKILPGPNL